MTAALSAVVVGADRLGNIPDLLKGHNIAITHHISGRDPSHQKRTLQLPSGTQLVILLTRLSGPQRHEDFPLRRTKGGYSGRRLSPLGVQHAAGIGSVRLVPQPQEALISV